MLYPPLHYPYDSIAVGDNDIGVEKGSDICRKSIVGGFRESYVTQALYAKGAIRCAGKSAARPPCLYTAQEAYYGFYFIKISRGVYCDSLFVKLCY